MNPKMKFIYFGPGSQFGLKGKILNPNMKFIYFGPGSQFDLKEKY